MAFNTNIGKQSFTASSGQTDFTFNFKIYTNTDLKVYKTPSGQAPDDTTDILTLTTDYTVVADGDNGGTVTLVLGATINDTLVILRDLPLVRTISYVENGDLVATTLNTDQDYQTYLIIDKSTEIANTVQLPKSVVGVSVFLPSVEADAYIKWNSTANALENDTTVPDAVVTSTTQAEIATTKASEASISASEALGYRNEAEGFRDEAEAYALSINPNDIVHKSGDETIADIKTFTSFPIAPSSAPTTAYQVANKKYVDDNKSIAVPVRQTVLKGNVDTSGFSAFGGSTGSTTVTASSTLVATCADGVNDRVGTIVNPSWTGLSTNGTMYLYLDIATDGTCTTGSTTLAPTYRWGGADVVTNLQNTFNIQEMKMKVGNGATATQVYRVFIGEVMVAGGVVNAITWYALMGRYHGVFVNTLPSVATAISINHNLGTSENKVQLDLKCLIADDGYAVGDIIVAMGSQGGTIVSPTTLWNTYKTAGFTTGSTQWGYTSKTTGANEAPTLASWAYRLKVERSW